MLASLTLPPPLGDLALAASQAPLGVMLGVFVLFVAAKLGEEVARRLGQPAVVGELFGGFIVGPGVLGLVVPGETAAVLAEIGVVILLFSVGLEVRLDDLLAVGRPAVLTAIIAMILPIAAGVAIGLGIGEELFPSLFIGLALAATSIGITSRVLAEMGVLDRTFARVVLGAAVIDDVLALILIGVVSGPRPAIFPSPRSSWRSPPSGWSASASRRRVELEASSAKSSRGRCSPIPRSCRRSSSCSLSRSYPQRSALPRSSAPSSLD